MLQGTDAEAIATTKIPRLVSGGFAVDDDWASNGAKRCGIIVEGGHRSIPRLRWEGLWWRG